MPDSPIQWTLMARCGKARRGRISTPHGAIDTPAFMPVGTRAAVKGVSPDQLAATGTQIVLANTYHLLLRPGAHVVRELGGLHRFMNWPGPILTDSGGFQVFSLADLRKLDDNGVVFRSHIDGAEVRLTPEVSIEVQHALGADVIMAFDECPPLGPGENVPRKQGNKPLGDASRDSNCSSSAGERLAIETAVRRTVAWAARSKARHVQLNEEEGAATQALYGIVQGGLDDGLRRACLEQLAGIGFDGYALGGLSVGEPPPEMWALLHEFADELPAEAPRYLMGVGTPRDLVEAVAAGIDQFDCVLPTRNGRKGYAFTSEGSLRLRNSRHRTSNEPLDPQCDCPTCRGFSRGYLRHLLLGEELLGATLVSLHNLRFYQALMARMRAAIEAGAFEALRTSLTACPLAGPSDEDQE